MKIPKEGVLTPSFYVQTESGYPRFGKNERIDKRQKAEYNGLAIKKKDKGDL